MNAYQNIYILLPGTGTHWQGGGLQVTQNIVKLLNKHVPTKLVTYRKREKDKLYIADVLKKAKPNDLFIITWGPHINELVYKLNGFRIIYYAQSFGWNISLPVVIPIVCISQYVVSQWNKTAPKNPLFLLSPVVEVDFNGFSSERDIDILIITRKSSKYLTKRLLPALKKECNVYLLEDFIPKEEVINLYKRSKIYIYSPSEKLSSGSVEGFGLQPLEALLCGCKVFCNIHGGLGDYLDPGINMCRLGTHSLDFDVACIVKQLNEGYSDNSENLSNLADRYSEETFHYRIENILDKTKCFFDYIEENNPEQFQYTSFKNKLSRKLNLPGIFH